MMNWIQPEILLVVRNTDCHQHMVEEAKKKTVQMEGTWRVESTSVGLHPCEALIQKQCEGCADTAWGRY